MGDGRERIEYERVEEELTMLLRDGYRVERGDLSLSAEQQETSDRNAEEVLAQIVGTIPFERARRRPRLRRRWLVGAAAAVAVAVGVVMSVVPFTPPPPSAHATSPPLIDIEGVDPSSYPLSGKPADARLEELADRVAAQPGIGGSGPIQQVESSAWWLDTEQTTSGAVSELVAVDVQRFVLPGDRIRIREERGAPITDDGDLGGQAAYVAVTSDETIPIDTGNPMEQPAQLPTEVGALRKVLLGPDPAECVDMEAYCITRAMQSLNLTFVLDQDLQAALIRSLGGEDDIRYAGAGRDRVGRQVEIFVVADPDGLYQHLVLFDAGTGVWMGSETVLTRNSPDIDVESPAVVEFNAITARALIARDTLPPIAAGTSPAD